MKRNAQVYMPAVAALVAYLSLVCPAQSPEKRGLEIAREADRRYCGFEDYTANLRMILRNREGQTSERRLRVRALETEEGDTRSLCLFDSPPDVKGTILLTHTHQTGDDDQWLYLPALKRVKRIAAQNKSGSFMGSEFAYEDIATQTLEKYTYRWLGDEVYDGNACHVIERYPKDKRNSGYTKQVVWLDKQEYRTLKVDYYDRKGSLLKTLVFEGYRRHRDEFWRAREMNVVNHQTGKSSRLIWSDFAFRTGLKESEFDRHSLTRIR
ncbi:MAG: outer membrane lipoprotein-sorting protein [Sedimentisphaerales bacterium]|nr:outer membrane lipoprotein-sorting protein [Sedimentisphaerales bacterium]